MTKSLTNLTPSEQPCELCAGKCRGHRMGHPEEWEPEPGSRAALKAEGVERIRDLSDATILRLIAQRERDLGFTRYADWIDGGCVPSEGRDLDYPQERIDDIRFYVAALALPSEPPSQGDAE